MIDVVFLIEVLGAPSKSNCWQYFDEIQKMISIDFEIENFSCLIKVFGSNIKGTLEIQLLAISQLDC